MKPHLRARLAPLLVALGFVLAVVGSKWALIDQAGSSLPTWDQWDGESEQMLRPWLEGRFHWQDLLAPHNEHRIVLTRLASLGLMIANGQWDARVMTSFNVLVHATSLALLLALAWRWLAGGMRWAFAALLLALTAVPYSADNTLFGFQSQFYFLQLLALLHLALTLREETFTWRWAAGQLAGLLALGTMGTGFLSAAALLAVLGTRWWRERRLPPALLVAGGWAVTLCLIGWFTRRMVEGHDHLKAQSPLALVQAAAEFLSWPVIALFPLSFVLAVPLAWFGVRDAWRGPRTRGDSILLGWVTWITLQVLALAYARGGSGSMLSGRYLDIAAVATALGFLALCRSTQGRQRTLLATGWLLLVSIGLWQQHQRAWTVHLPNHLSVVAKQERNTRQYLATGDAEWLRRPAFGEIPYPVADVLIQRLAPASVRAVLPAVVREPVPLAPFATAALPPEVPEAPGVLLASTWAPEPAALPTPAGAPWRSDQAAPTRLPLLRLYVTGAVRATEGPQLWLCTAKSREALRPAVLHADTWQSITCDAPATAWWLEIEPAATPGWLAVTTPVELGLWSWITEGLLRQANLLWVLGLELLVLGFILYPKSTTAPAPAGPAGPAAAAPGAPGPGEVRAKLPPLRTALVDASTAWRRRWPRVTAGRTALAALWERRPRSLPGIGFAVGFTLAIGKLWFVSAQRLTLADPTLHDAASHLARAARWLGADAGSGASGSIWAAIAPASTSLYASWLSGLHALHVPLVLGPHLLYLGACGLLVWAVRPRLGGPGAAVALFALLWLQPMSYHAGLTARAVPEQLAPAAALLLLAGLASLGRSGRARQPAAGRHGVGGGILVGASAAVLLGLGGTNAAVLFGGGILAAVGAVQGWRAGRARELIAPAVAATLAALAVLVGSALVRAPAPSGAHDARAGVAATATAAATAIAPGPLARLDHLVTARGFTAYPAPSTAAPELRRAAQEFARWPVQPDLVVAPDTTAQEASHLRALHDYGKTLRWVGAVLVYSALPWWLWLTVRRVRSGARDGAWALATAAGAGVLASALLPWGAPAATGDEPRQFAAAYPLALLFGALAWWRGLEAADLRLLPRLCGAAARLADRIAQGAAWPELVRRARQPGVQAAVAAALAVGVLFVRKTDVFFYPQLWSEDSAVFFLQNDLHGAAAIFTPYSNYLHLLPRLIAWLGTPFAPGGTPAFFHWAAIAATLLVTVKVFSPRIDLPAKFWFALTPMLVPHQGEVFANITNIHWTTALLFPLLLISADARTRAQHARDLGLAVLSGLSGPFSILAAPLFLWRWWRRRTRASLLLAAVVVACAAVQAGLIVSAAAVSPRTGEFAPLAALAVIARRGPLMLVLGPLRAGFLTPATVILLGASLVAGLAWLTAQRPARREAVLICWAWAGLLLAASTVKDRFDLYGFDDLHNGDRYFFEPKVLLLWLLGLVASWRDTPGRVALVAIALSFAANATHFRLPPLIDYRWSDYVDRLRAGEPVVVPTNPAGWTMSHPGKTRADR